VFAGLREGDYPIGMGIEDEKLRQKVQGLMRVRGLSRRAAAIKAGLPDSTLRTWLKKPESSITVESLAQLAEGLGVELWSLFPDAPSLNPRSRAFLRMYGSLSEKGRKSIDGMIEELSGSPLPEEPPSGQGSNLVAQAEDRRKLKSTE
jgi:transcriptional regulator with XRE-family HTH domain